MACETYEGEEESESRADHFPSRRGSAHRTGGQRTPDGTTTEENQRAVLLSLVADVGFGYLRLLELDAELAIAEEAVKAFQGTLQLFTRKYEGGVASKLEVTRAAAAEAQAAAWIPPIKIAIEAQENRLSVLMGRPPGPIPRGKPSSSNGFRMFRRVSRPSCSSAGPTSWPPSRGSSRATPKWACRWATSCRESV